jgi:hypothetical protein
VAFLIEDTGVRISCLLNPESVVVRRQAGVRVRRTLHGALTGLHLADDPLLFTGGGHTEVELDLVFDVALAAGSTITPTDVRDLTAPLSQLAENAPRQDGSAQPARVRFVWGKSWNVPAIVDAVAERLEYFTAEGAPQRSWLRLRLIRIAEATSALATDDEPGPALPMTVDELPPLSPDSMDTHEVLAGGTDVPSAEPERSVAADRPVADAASSERLDDLAARYYGDPRLWRLLAAVNGVDDPLRIPPGMVLRIPPRSVVRGTA